MSILAENQPQPNPQPLWHFWSLPLGLLAIILLVRYYNQRQHGQLPLPPGPKGWPLIGSLPDVLSAASTGTMHLLYQKWATEYGPLFQVNVGPVTQYMVNTDVATKAIFDGKAAASAADRPRWIVSNEHMCNEWNVLFLNASDERWKLQRKVAHGTMTSVPRADAGLASSHFESLKFLYNLSRPSGTVDNTAIWAELLRYTYSTVTTQAFGLEVPSADSAAMEYIHETGKQQILSTLPGSHLVDIFPILDNLPLMLKPWERDGRARFRQDQAWCQARLDRLKSMPDRSQISSALLCRVLDDEKNMGFNSEIEAAYFALMMVFGAADTSLISIWSFLEAMIRHPDAMCKGQEAIDVVCKDRVPVYEDIEHIPYVRCLVKETWRWRPPVPLGHPHQVTKDIEYDGMRIPKDSRIQLNAWAIHRQPSRGQQLDDFIPERYANDSTTTMQSINQQNPQQRDHFAFGAGRRICPGYNVAERSLAVGIMRILWAFDIRTAADAKLPLESTDFPGIMPGCPGESMPVAFEVREGKREVIEELFAEANAARATIMSIE